LRAVTSKRRPDFDLGAAILDPGFTPRASDADALVAALSAADAREKAAERALLRLGAAAIAPAVAGVAKAEGQGRALLIRLLGRLGTKDQELGAALLAGLADGDERVRRAAAIALGKVEPAGAAEALAAAAQREASASVRRALIEALGKVGGDAARGVIAAEAERGDPEVSRERARAALRIDRAAARAEPSTLDLTRTTQSLVVALRCRAGLEPILMAELPPALGAKVVREPTGSARVEGTLRGAPASLFAARTMLSFGFPLPAVRAEGDPAAAVIAALTAPRALVILRRFTVGPIRYRLAFPAGGKRRATVWRVAEEAAARVPDLVNDPVDSPWEVVVHEGPGAVRVELCPNVPDPRFAYRRADVPAASHPTIAAALVRAAGVRPDDVVWDPFVGAGLELCERALAGPYVRLTGSDLDEAALAAARANLEAAGARDFALLQGDATELRPSGPRPTLIVTNPPLGRRVQRSAELGPMLDRFVEHAAAVLSPGGRLVWISPFPERTRGVAAARGLSLSSALRVDMGGFAGELEVLEKPARATIRS